MPTNWKPVKIEVWKSEPSCSKLTMSLVKLSLKFWSCIFVKNVSTFAFAKATHIFFSKNTCELDIVLTGTVIILTISLS